jgi:hypothetical protein
MKHPESIRPEPSPPSSTHLCFNDQENSMLVAVYHVPQIDAAKDRGVMHFDALPRCGDTVEIEQLSYLVERVWHTPSPFYAGPKVAVLISETVENSVGIRLPALASA